ncbi:hypothetical protein BDV97DRAFT_397823 [Delphinella strobiligena]|nr:hypothetical protein BDV97DRAFT_397823 [Delphinella strobiligena]
MGFFSGFIGGATLTTAIFYLSLDLHHRNRLHQAALLRQQALLLNNVVDPLPPQPPPTARTVQAGLSERIKDRWNTELSAAVRRLQTFDWNGAREGVEEGASKLWSSVGK